MFEALAIGLVERFQLLRGAGISHELVAGQQHWFHASRQQRFGGSAAEHIDDGGTSNRGNRAGTPFQALELDEAIARRALVVDDQICEVDELLA